MCLPFLTFPSFLKKPINKKIKECNKALTVPLSRGPSASSLKVQQYQFVTKTVTVITNCTDVRYVGTILSSRLIL